VSVVGEGFARAKPDDEPVEELPALKDTEFYFTLDEEALCIYDHFASLITTHDFRFYKEPTPKSVETIFSCHDEDQLELQCRDNVFYLHPASTQQVSSSLTYLVKLKGAYMRRIHHRAARRHLPYGITQGYLPPDTSECTPP